MTAIEDIAAERQRQIEVEGWTPEHDDEHGNEELAHAAACYALGTREVGTNPDNLTYIWPWHADWWKPSDRRRQLVKAGALIAAEIERLDRVPNIGDE